MLSRYGCKLVPISLRRIENTTFEMTVHSPYKIEKTINNDEDTKNITLKINQIIEKMIINNPKQWLWSHNRWKYKCLKKWFLKLLLVDLIML